MPEKLTFEAKANAGDAKADAGANSMRGLLNAMLKPELNPMQMAMDHYQANMGFVAKVNQIMMRGGQSLFARQSEALQGTLDALTSVNRNRSTPKDMTAMAEMHRTYSDVCAKRALEHLKVSLDAARELADLAFAATAERLNGAANSHGPAAADSAGKSKI